MKIIGKIYNGYAQPYEFKLELTNKEIEDIKSMNEQDKTTYIDQLVWEYAIENKIDVGWEVVKE